MNLDDDQLKHLSKPLISMTRPPHADGEKLRTAREAGEQWAERYCQDLVNIVGLRFHEIIRVSGAHEMNSQTQLVIVPIQQIRHDGFYVHDQPITRLSDDNSPELRAEGVSIYMEKYRWRAGGNYVHDGRMTNREWVNQFDFWLRYLEDMNILFISE